MFLYLLFLDESLIEVKARSKELIHKRTMLRHLKRLCENEQYKDICNEFNANYGIFGNGNQIIDLKTDKVIYTSFLSQHELNTSIEIAKVLHKLPHSALIIYH